MGTVVAGAGDHYSGKLTRKERKKTLVEEVLADEEAVKYAKRKYDEISEDRQAGAKGSRKMKKKNKRNKKRKHAK